MTEIALKLKAALTFDQCGFFRVCQSISESQGYSTSTQANICQR